MIYINAHNISFSTQSHYDIYILLTVDVVTSMLIFESDGNS